MGSRASYILIEEGKVRVFAEQWGAEFCVGRMLEGPKGCAAAARDTGETGELMHRAFCEGGYLLDFDRKVALFYGALDDARTDELAASLTDEDVEQDDPILAALLRKSRRKWPGWQLRVVGNGSEDFAEYLDGRGLSGQLQ